MMVYWKTWWIKKILFDFSELQMVHHKTKIDSFVGLERMLVMINTVFIYTFKIQITRCHDRVVDKVQI